MSEEESFNKRLQKMKRSIKLNKGILTETFPDDVTYSGSSEQITHLPKDDLKDIKTKCNDH
jgi:hypothetical protein